MDMDKYLESFREMISHRGLADHTLISYSTYIKAYLFYLQDEIHVSPENASWQQMRDFLVWIQRKRHLSNRTVNFCRAQLRFFTLYVLHKPWDDTQVPSRRFDVYLPYVPTREEVLQFLTAVENPKAQSLLTLMYSSGLRVGEACALRYEDISRSEMRIHITHSKNRSDRYVPLSANALKILTSYWRKCGKPTGWLFPQQNNPDKHVIGTFLDRHIRKTEKSLHWEHRITCHTLRHAYATHLYERGTDLVTIKHLLGHKSIQATSIYISLARTLPNTVISPFDTGDARYE